MTLNQEASSTVHKYPSRFLHKQQFYFLLEPCGEEEGPEKPPATGLLGPLVQSLCEKASKVHQLHLEKCNRGFEILLEVGKDLPTVTQLGQN